MNTYLSTASAFASATTASLTPNGACQENLPPQPPPPEKQAHHLCPRCAPSHDSPHLLQLHTLSQLDNPIDRSHAGGPGSGKGTQCDRIVRDFGYTHLSTGDLLRDEVKKGTEIGRQCEQLMEDGKLVPVEVTLKLIKKAMKEGKKNNTKGFLIDGFPRAVDQAEMFEKKVTLIGDLIGIP